MPSGYLVLAEIKNPTNVGIEKFIKFRFLLKKAFMPKEAIFCGYNLI